MRSGNEVSKYRGPFLSHGNQPICANKARKWRYNMHPHVMSFNVGKLPLFQGHLFHFCYVNTRGTVVCEGKLPPATRFINRYSLCSVYVPHRRDHGVAQWRWTVPIRSKNRHNIIYIGGGIVADGVFRSRQMGGGAPISSGASSVVVQC